MEVRTETIQMEVWVDSEKRIASFSKLEGINKMEFEDREHYLNYLQELVKAQYRFQ